MENKNGAYENMSDNDRIVACSESIKKKITEACGKSDFIEEETWVALSGTQNNPKLVLTVSLVLITKAWTNLKTPLSITPRR